MNIFKTFALTATLLAGGATATLAASPYDVMDGVSSLGSIQEARGATVLQVNANEAFTLKFDNDVSSVQARVKNNPSLIETIERQGYTIEQIVGVAGDLNSLTLYAL
ncbi:hypothetical protein [Devosia beringensis]|uniref:hypothetical protein n=1 Tax=Devosia beringensis TaxID=2657486 RepID=UPI00186BAA92|nr:hypothetical protein [Devosia beringensis]